MTPRPNRPSRRPDRPAGSGSITRGEQDARAVALDVLIAVDRDDAYANLLLPHRIREARLTGADAAFATELAYGTLRNRGRYDAIIAIAANRELDAIDGLALQALRMGAHQLLAMRVPTHAAVNETVGLVRSRKGQGAAGFVNANLRTIAGASLDEWDARIRDRAADPIAAQAAIASHPEWIVRAFDEALADEGRAGELDALLAADNVSPAVQLAALPGLADRDEVVAAHPTRLEIDDAAPTAMRLDGGDPASLTEVHAGRVRVQDAGSQLVALALTRVAPLRSGERLLDLCAGPGGKSAMLAAEALVADADFLANEVTPARANLVRDALRPLTAPGEELPVNELDGRTVAEAPDSFDRILVDAPCSGLGALRRRPEARWRKTPSDLAALTRLQEELLDAALTAAVPGGLVAYVTCSPHLAETTAVVRRMLRRGDVDVLDTRSAVLALAPGLDLPERTLGGGTSVQLWPHRHGTDAMFLALLRKHDR